ncbi:hypothetical protein [Agromyces sp. Marseille-Q5079]|uniref:hypothetical protein n=1 Tax=Agromyces sp. Marseille-Q5079 TaxID=3439059 RepID=UPI003D9C8F29
MNGSFARGTLAFAALMLLGTGLSGCGSNSNSESSEPAAASEEAEAPVEAPADLIGEWVQTDSGAEDTYQSATITADTIEVYWVNEAESTTALYWAGTFEAPTEAGAYSWDSLNDVEKTGTSILASGDPTKTFSYDDDAISYDVTALGVTKTVQLERK